MTSRKYAKEERHEAIVNSAAAGEYRFASSAAKRLASLGAILKGNRDALGAGQNLKTFDIDNKYGQKVRPSAWHDVLCCCSFTSLAGTKLPFCQAHRPRESKGVSVPARTG
jgi:hypothetical protein